MEDNHTSKPHRQCGNTVEAISAYFTLWLERLERFYEERDRRYEDRFKAQETAVAAALASAEKLTAQAFAASKEAISKAEVAQTSYNAGHNDLSRKMENQYKDMLPRTESDSKFKNLEEKIDEWKKEKKGTSQWAIGISIIIGSSILGFFIALVQLFLKAH